jgi:hypothetical protein
MRRPSCGFENPVGRRLYGQYATPLTGSCPTCGIANQPSFLLCAECATRVINSLVAAPPQAPLSYTRWLLAKQILTSKIALKGERKRIIVLFVDLKGSMKLLADCDLEEAGQLLNPVIEHLKDTVHR